MFSQLFEDRDKKISYLIKLGDCIGRSLRENVILFSIDSQNKLVTYLTESNKVISGEYEIGKDVTLNKIDLKDSSIFEDTELFDTFVSDKLHTFVESIHYNEYGTADTSFTDILSLWENRVKLNTVQHKLFEKTEKLQSIAKIVESSTFQQLIEVTPQLIEFLKENKEKIKKVPEVRNAVNLSNTVSNAFNFPKLTHEELVENKSYTLKDGINESIYEMICRQELVKKELIESKKEFELIWASNSVVRKLASMIFEEKEQIVDVFCEAIQEVPYIALASKKTLFNTFSNCLAQTDGIGVSEKDIQQFASTIFELKKEVKEDFINTINEKYGINIQNLQESVSFKSLINTQIVIFEALSRLSPKESILKQVLSETAYLLKNKAGVEGIDVNDYLREVFNSAGYDQIFEATATTEKPSLKRVSKSKREVFKNKVRVAKASEYEDNENVDMEALEAEDEGGRKAEVKAAAKEGDTELEKAGEEEEETPVEPEAEESAEAPEETEEGPGEDEESVGTPATQKEANNDLTELESMVKEIAAELGNKDNEEEK